MDFQRFGMRPVAATALAFTAALTLAVTPAMAQERRDGVSGSVEDVDRMELDNNIGPSAGDWEMTLGGTGASDEDAETGDFNVTGEFGYYLTDEIIAAVRQNVGYNDDGAGTDWRGSTRIAADYQFDLNRWRPFIGANIGYVYGEDVQDTWAAGPEAGVKYFIKDDAFLFGRAEYQFFFDSGNEIDDKFDDGSFVYTVGVGLTF